MTSHPRRRSGDDDLAAEALEGTSAILRTGNGIPPGLRPDAAKLIGQACAEAIAQVLPGALASVLAQVPVQGQLTGRG